ncbi:MAG TPA: sensor histidine kinase KdpD [Steroidobacteraceae bacterium]|nr:sensor histidine kinase KdpD [Steroidobacteraceae bacterium]
MSEDRPSPDALLAETRREGRGRLKIFLGAAPGVGKTYEMLSVARRRKAEGVDVVVGVVETHGRAETLALLEGLPVVPPRRVSYRGREFEELDLDALLARRPQLALVDELAHTNVPGSRHEKRFQDVEELLRAGIDVLTTLNVQHIESLNDLVERITGVKVRERLPDRVLETADEIELIDLPPEELTKRLREGKVYVPEDARRAVQNFFTRGNLLVLRELAMRMAVERVDADLQNYMRARAIEGPWPARERILVCIGANDDAERLVRLGKRIAERRQLPWIVLHVQAGLADEMRGDARERLQQAFVLAEQLGAEAVTVAGGSLANEVLAYAADHNVAEIVVGRTRRRLARLRLRPSLAQALIDRGTEFDITVANQTEDEEPRRLSTAARLIAPRTPERAWVESILLVAAAAGIAWLLDRYLIIEELSLVFLVAVLVAAIRHGLAPGLLAAILASLAFNFLFTEPRLTLHVTHPSDLLSIIFFLIVSVIGGNLAARLRGQMQVTRTSAEQATLLYDFSRRIAGAISQEDLLRSTCRYLTDTLGFESVAIRSRADGGLGEAIGVGEPPALIDIDTAAAEWSVAHGEPAGSGTGTLPASWWLFVPLASAKRPLGVLGVNLGALKAVLTPEQRRLLFAMRDQTAVALDRMVFAEEVKRTQLVSETDRLRSALLSSVSHDLRTPLASITGAATSLAQLGETMPAAGRRELLDTIIEEAERLNRFVQNLLDMTRLGYGALAAHSDWCDLREVVGRARARLEQPLREHRLEIDIAPEAALIYADPTLLEQVLVNLLDNAAKFSPAGSDIAVTASVAAREVLIEVLDEGPGIPTAERERVFDMFYRVRASDQRRPGTGLGLAICKGFVEAMGGTIAVRGGRDGHGTGIALTLPRREPPVGRVTAAA